MNTPNFFAWLIIALFSCVVEQATSSSIGNIVPPSLGNPCVSFCDDDGGGDPSSQACATCCRTVEHEIPWNCDLLEDEGELKQGEEVEETRRYVSPAPWVASFLATSTATQADDAVAASCAGDWQPEWWNVPSADNLGHACSMCCGECSDSFNGCGNCAQTGECSCGGCDSDGVCQERRGLVDWLGPGGIVFFFFVVVGCSVCCLALFVYQATECLLRHNRGQEQPSNTDAVPPKTEVKESGSV